MQLDRDKLANAREAVARGVDLLDREGPVRWRQKIRKDTLDLGDAQLCILGQTFVGHFDEGNEKFRAEVPDYSPEKYGFEMDAHNEAGYGSFGYPELGRAWEEELFPEMFKVTYDTVENLIDERFERLHQELPNTIRESLREVFRSL